jgi:serine/threonine protein kinase
MGSVYLSYTRGGLPVALKIIRREFADDPEFRRRFSREVQAARRVQGAYTAAVLDSSTDGPQPWLASAYVAGPPLSTAVREHGPLPMGTLLKLAAGAAEALQSIHAAGVVHRDLKPSNVLLASDGPRVIDFGIAWSADATAVTGTGVRVGTPAYMSPEQALGRPTGPALDIFPLGLIIFYAATGQHPFGEGGGQELLYRIVSGTPDLTLCPEPLRPLVESCLAPDPTERPDPEEIIATCRRLAEAEGSQLERDNGWWLPQALADDVTARLTLPPPLPAGPLPPEKSERVRVTPRTRIVLVGVAALVIGIGATLGAVRLGGGTDNSGKDGEATGTSQSTGPTDSGEPTGSGSITKNNDTPPPLRAEWELGRQDVPVVLPAPTPTDESMSNCDFAPATAFSAKNLTVSTKVEAFLAFSSISPHTFSYVDCTGSNDTTVPDDNNGIRVGDGEGFMNTIGKRDPSPVECLAAARKAALPNPISLASLREGIFRKGEGLCIETPDGHLDYLLITEVRPEPEKDNLPTFLMVATQWVKKTN